MIRAIALAFIFSLIALAVAAAPEGVAHEPPETVGSHKNGGVGGTVQKTWVEWPRRFDFQDLFPERALEACRSGRTRVDCQIRADGRTDCVVGMERPRGWGFGESSLRAARRFRMAPQTEDGRPVDGGAFKVSFYWETDRQPSDREEDCHPELGGQSVCVTRLPCTRPPQPPPFG